MQIPGNIPLGSFKGDENSNDSSLVHWFQDSGKAADTLAAKTNMASSARLLFLFQRSLLGLGDWCP